MTKTGLSTMELVKQGICALCEKEEVAHAHDMCQGCIDFIEQQEKEYAAEMEEAYVEYTHCEECGKKISDAHERKYGFCGECEDIFIEDYERRMDRFEY